MKELFVDSNGYVFILHGIKCYGINNLAYGFEYYINKKLDTLILNYK